MQPLESSRYLQRGVSRGGEGQRNKGGVLGELGLEVLEGLEGGLVGLGDHLLHEILRSEVLRVPFLW
jgi:hypothetical protein